MNALYLTWSTDCLCCLVTACQNKCTGGTFIAFTDGQLNILDINKAKENLEKERNIYIYIYIYLE
jgi:hypothetical protein